VDSPGENVVAPVVAHDATTVASQTTTVSTGGRTQGWMSANLRNFVVICMTGTLCYLVYKGNEQAQTAIIQGFMLLMGALWGERAALKVPGQDS
jgi:hypothetical protein